MKLIEIPINQSSLLIMAPALDLFFVLKCMVNPGEFLYVHQFLGRVIFDEDGTLSCPVLLQA